MKRKRFAEGQITGLREHGIAPKTGSRPKIRSLGGRAVRLGRQVRMHGRGRRMTRRVLSRWTRASAARVPWQTPPRRL